MSRNRGSAVAKQKAKPIRLPDGFRTMVEAKGATASGTFDERRAKAIARVCDRAQRMSDAGELYGETSDEIAERIYGSVWLWLTLWRYRAVIWWAIRLIAAIANSKQRDEATVVSIFEELPAGESTVFRDGSL